MGNQFTKVTRNSWGSRLSGSVTGVLIGLFLIPFSLWGLWVNEGSKDLSVLAKESVVVSADAVDDSKNGVFAAVSGKLTTEDEIGDDPFHVPGKYVQLRRVAEMYAWKEQSESNEQTDTVGGGSTTTTTYTYTKEWTTSPADSSSFEYPDGHENPQMSVDNANFLATAAKVGAYDVDPQSISLPGTKAVDARPVENIEGFVKKGRYLYNREGASSAPQVGDIRVSHEAIKSGVSVTAMGMIQDGSIQSYTKNDMTIYRVFDGTRQDAIDQLHLEYVILIWIIRILGIIGLRVGLGLLVDPIIKILDVVGVVGSIAEGVMGIINSILAIVIGGLTIIVSMLLHNIYVLIFLILLIIGAAVYYLRNKSLKSLAAGLLNKDDAPAPATATAGADDTSPPKIG
ncbi:MAG: TMEM43 family protein [Chloroflexaceae bacterium]|jgi:hypothetical protein|nr:TMEM43 family protein [Chloroflexaceae bacterium]MCE2851682.1 TMEM43 family protein [Chloroflexaceae bacterium]